MSIAPTIELAAMPLMSKLFDVPLTFECPHCKHPLIKNGSWFRGARHFACGASQCRVPITYSEKLMLFAKHAHLVERSSLSEAGGRRRS